MTNLFLFPSAITYVLDFLAIPIAHILDTAIHQHSLPIQTWLTTLHIEWATFLYAIVLIHIIIPLSFYLQSYNISVTYANFLTLFKKKVSHSKPTTASPPSQLFNLNEIKDRSTR